MNNLFRHYVEQAYEHEKALNHGRAVDLTQDETREVIDAWVDHYRASPYPINWPRIRKAILRRSFGDEWRP